MPQVCAHLTRLRIRLTTTRAYLKMGKSTCCFWQTAERSACYPGQAWHDDISRREWSELVREYNVPNEQCLYQTSLVDLWLTSHFS